MISCIADSRLGGMKSAWSGQVRNRGDIHALSQACQKIGIIYRLYYI